MASVATDPQLVLKITPPRISKTVLERARLSSTRPEFSDKAVIALQTPAGSGKTSLLAQWRKEALQTGAIVAWLTLDVRDNDNRLVRGLTAGMRVASGKANFGQDCLRAVEFDQGELAGVTEWLAAVAELSSETLLILDDVHTLPEATLGSALIYLLLNAPANLRIVLSSRKSIALPISELPARGSFVALSAKDLRFDQSETVALLRARFGQRIDPDSCVRLYELTEGWPLGLQLAVSTIERSQNLRDAIAGFSVQHSDIQRYFVDCLLDQLPADMVQFLVSVSFVDALSASFCDAITGRTNSAAILRELCDRTPIFSEGVNSDWMRIHPLAAEFLREHFERLPELERRNYRSRAGDWLIERTLCEAAARHLLNAGLEDRAYKLVEHSLHDLMDTGQVVRVTDWLERLPRAEIERRIKLRLTMGWMLALSERHTEAEKLVGPVIDDESADAGDRCESAEICGTAALFADDIGHMEHVVATWSDQFSKHSSMIHLVGLNQQAFIALYSGSPEKARIVYAPLASTDLSPGRYTLGWRDWIIGFSYLWEGQVELAAKTLRDALELAEKEAGRRSPVAVMLAALLATAHWECNQTAEAAALLADRLDVLERRTPPDAIAMGYITATRLAVLANEEQRAFDLLDYLFALGSSRGLPRLCIAALGERIRMHAFRGRGDICAVVVRGLDDVVSSLGAHRLGLFEPVVRLQIGIARVYSSIARQDWSGALEQLNQLAPEGERLRRGREALQIYLLRALAKKRCGEDGTRLLAEALSMSTIWGLKRILADTHPDLPDWARQIEAGKEANTGLLEHVVAPVQKVATTRARVASSSLLSPKEREVLQLLAGNMSNKQIALAMGVSDETIKWHLKNLFGKLNAGTRKHLLDRARVMGILDTGSA